MFNLTWGSNAVIAMFLYIPFMLTVKYFEKTWGISYPIALVIYGTGVVVGIIFWLMTGQIKVFIDNTNLDQIIIISSVIFTIGIICGSTANLFLYGSITKAPNPGLPVIVSNFGIVLLFLISYLLYTKFPDAYPKTEFDLTRFIGIIAGIFCISLVLLGNNIWIYLKKLFT